MSYNTNPALVASKKLRYSRSDTGIFAARRFSKNGINIFYHNHSIAIVEKIPTIKPIIKKTTAYCIISDALPPFFLAVYAPNNIPKIANEIMSNVSYLY